MNPLPESDDHPGLIARTLMFVTFMVIVLVVVTALTGTLDSFGVFD